MKAETPIIKKVKKVEGAGHHGGSWKVAYADFVTAMMAFFLLLWLITMASPEKRARVANYFKYFSLFEKSGTSIMEGHSGVVDSPKGIEMESIDEGEKKGLEEKEEPPSTGKETSEYGPGMNKSDLAEKLKVIVQYSLMELRDQILVEESPDGVVIQIVDKEGGKSMFASGSAELSHEAKNILRVITDAIGGLSNKIAIDGHTDAIGFGSSTYTNWELSTQRASMARREMEKYGLNPDKIARVSGYAATRLLIPENPKDPRNRRISITVLFSKDKRF